MEMLFALALIAERREDPYSGAQGPEHEDDAEINLPLVRNES
jgi:hypothetical protein